MQFPFEVGLDQIRANPSPFIDGVYSDLESGFTVMPRGLGFVQYSTLLQGYETLKSATDSFRDLDVETVVSVVYEAPIVLVILRCMLGFTPSEWAEVADRNQEARVSQSQASTLDRDIRLSPSTDLRRANKSQKLRIYSMVKSACDLLVLGASSSGSGTIHRLDKVDTVDGLQSIRSVAARGVSYPELLYERLLGRPFASHRDSVSELIGEVVENAIEAVLQEAGISFWKLGWRESLTGFDQVPDFVVPGKHDPKVVIEAKLAEDDGTARDKVTRIQHLASLSERSQGGHLLQQPRFEVIACIAGRGFRVRREDMKKLLIATRGKVFTLVNIHRMIKYTRLREFAIRRE